jgi:hypothetical protein
MNGWKVEMCYELKKANLLIHVINTKKEQKCLLI